MSEKEIAEARGYYNGLQRAGNMAAVGDDEGKLSILRANISRAMTEIEERLQRENNKRAWRGFH